jgi:uncharacterized membrane protein YphA (DoxX/SURF4 family)
MSVDAATKNTIVPLILRLALAAIFLYHGAMKVLNIGPDAKEWDNGWGASWAGKVWKEQRGLPRSVRDKLDQLKEEAPESPDDATSKKGLPSREEIAKVKAQLETEFNKASGALPETLGQVAVQMAVAWGEVAGGLALLLGLLTRIAAAGMLVIQAGAVYMVTFAMGYSTSAVGGYEYNVALGVMCLCLILSGGGACSMDRLLFPHRGANKATA